MIALFDPPGFLVGVLLLRGRCGHGCPAHVLPSDHLEEQRVVAIEQVDQGEAGQLGLQRLHRGRLPERCSGRARISCQADTPMVCCT